MIDEKTLKEMDEFIESIPEGHIIDCYGVNCSECPMDLGKSFMFSDDNPDGYSCSVCILRKIKLNLEKKRKESQ